MKPIRLILLATFLFSCMFCTAQDIYNKSLRTTWGLYEPSGQPFDTLKTATAVYLYSGPIIGYKDAVTITGVSTEIGDSVTAGTVSIEISSDGTNWTSYYNTFATSYTETLTNVATAQVFRWELYNVTDKYFRVKWISTGGTISVGITATYSVYNKPTR